VQPGLAFTATLRFLRSFDTKERNERVHGFWTVAEEAHGDKLPVFFFFPFFGGRGDFSTFIERKILSSSGVLGNSCSLLLERAA
jgi:hypothetical protein